MPTSQSSNAPSSGRSPSLGVLLLRATFSKNPISIYTNTGNDTLGVVAGELGGGPRRIDASGNLLYENVQGPTGFVVKDVLGEGKDNAVALGHVILNSSEFKETTPGGAWWIAHEDAHVRQAALLGPGYLPAYVILWLLSGMNHDAHPMEIMADEYAYEYWQEYQQQGGQTP